MPTFEDVMRAVRLQAPDVPAMLARRFVTDTYLTLTDRRGWQWRRAETTLQVADARSVTVTVTNGSATVTSAALFLLADQGRQFRIGTGDTFTILTFTDASTIILDRAYTGVDATDTASILDAYYTAPSTFARFDTIVDLVQQRRISYWTSQDELNRIDPKRLQEGVPRLLSPRLLSTGGLPTFEWWPRPANAASFPALYVTRAAAPADTDSLTGVLAQRLDVLETGALARCAKWPGTTAHPNAYFSLPLAQALQLDFERLAVQLDLRDDDITAQDWAVDEFWGRYSAWDYAANLTTLRATDAGIGEYLGGW